VTVRGAPSGASRAALAMLVAAGLALGPGVTTAQDAGRQALALELARVLIDDQMRQGLSDQVTLGLVRLIGTSLQERLNRRLQEGEVRTLAEIVRSFVGRTLTSTRIEEIGARAYASHFDEAELRMLLDFQRSPVGRKAARLTPAIGLETAQAIEAEIQQSPAVPRLMEELQAAFPVFRPESP
jgi:hypothetical protein